MDNFIQKAFTLIELLVVIAIIGILSGLIIVGMSSSVRSATVAKAQIFSSSLRDSLLMNLVSDWKFDGNSNDAWSSNNCTWYGSGSGTTTVNWRPTSECIYNQCLNLDGIDDYLDCGNGANLNITNSLTIEGWINLQPTGSFQALVDKVWSNGYSILIQDSRGILGYYSGGGSPTFYTVSVPAGSFNWNEWAYITYTFTTTSAKLYVNAIEKGSKVPEGNITTNGTNVRIGDSGSYFLKGKIDGIRIYNAAIPASKIKEQYYSGLINLYAKREINKDLYEKNLSGATNTIAQND